MTKSTLFKTLLIGLLPVRSVFFAPTATAQNTSEIGVGLGGLTYKGELSPSYQFRNNRPAFTAFYRKDISAPVTLRAGLMGGMLRATDQTVKGVNGTPTPLAAYRNSYMKGSLLEVSGVMEYNFFDYHDRHDKVHLTPYVFVGVAGFYAHTKMGIEGGNSGEYQGNFGVAIPAGLGLKYAVSKHWNLGLEMGARKTFTDKLDGYGKDLPSSGSQDEVRGNPHDQDWYFYNGVSVSYTFYKIRCPDKNMEKGKKE